MTRTAGTREITVYVGIRPFKGEWVERNETVLNGLAWQKIPGLAVKLVCWPSEIETVEYAARNHLGCVVVPWTRHYLFPGPLHSFKQMFETALMDCDTDLFVYINGDIVLGPGILRWIREHAEPRTLYSMPRHNWRFTGTLERPEQFEQALAESIPEEWTALDLFAFHARDGRRALMPVPPFLLTAGSMDSWLVVHAGAKGWRRRLIPPDTFRMLHIEHPVSHPLKPGADPGRLAKWAFNCGVYAAATQGLPPALTEDASLACFEGAEPYRESGLPRRTYEDPAEVMERARGADPSSKGGHP